MLDFHDPELFKSCIHCGMCLPHCPTYQLTQKEKHSPRGRLFYMKSAAEDSDLLSKDFDQEMNYCLGCLACEFHCPAGIPYSHFLEHSRSESRKFKSPWSRFLRKFLLNWPFQSVERLRLLSYWGNFILNSKVFQFFAKSLPSSSFKNALEQFPKMKFLKLSTTENVSMDHKVFLHPGCVQKFIFPETNQSSINVLEKLNCQVSCPETAPCCGSLHAHNGEIEMARKLARENIDLWEKENPGSVVSNAGGCGSHLKKLHLIFDKNDEYYSKAQQWSSRVVDIHQYLCQFDLPEITLNKKTRVSFHDSCHLKHSQRVYQEPRQLLGKIKNLEVLENKQSYECCGAAGIYSIIHPETAQKLSSCKAQDLNKNNPDFILTTNPGCQMILEQRLKEAGGDSPEILHTVEFIDRCYQDY